jgi:hypothetical protein
MSATHFRDVLRVADPRSGSSDCGRYKIVIYENQFAQVVDSLRDAILTFSKITKNYDFQRTPIVVLTSTGITLGVRDA